MLPSICGWTLSFTIRYRILAPKDSGWLLLVKDKRHDSFAHVYWSPSPEAHNVAMRSAGRGKRSAARCIAAWPWGGVRLLEWLPGTRRSCHSTPYFRCGECILFVNTCIQTRHASDPSMSLSVKPLVAGRSMLMPLPMPGQRSSAAAQCRSPWSPAVSTNAERRKRRYRDKLQLQP